MLSIKKSGVKENQIKKEKLGKLKLKATPNPLMIAKIILFIYLWTFDYGLYLPQHFLYFLPEPQGQGSFLPAFFPDTFGALAFFLAGSFFCKGEYLE